MAGLPTKRGMKKRKLIQTFPCRRLAIFFLERTVITAILMTSWCRWLNDWLLSLLLLKGYHLGTRIRIHERDEMKMVGSPLIRRPLFTLIRRLLRRTCPACCDVLLRARRSLREIRSGGGCLLVRGGDGETCCAHFKVINTRSEIKKANKWIEMIIVSKMRGSDDGTLDLKLKKQTSEYKW